MTWTDRYAGSDTCQASYCGVVDVADALVKPVLIEGPAGTVKAELASARN
jgi:hypothetical protein